MGWGATHTAIKNLLEGHAYKEAPEFFSVEKLPSSIADKMFCVQMDELRPNPDMHDKQDRFYPRRTVRISLIYELFNASTTEYDASIEDNDKVIQYVIDPANRAPEVRIVEFAGTRTKLYNDQGNWLVVDNVFAMEIVLTYPPS